jgi:hypothetical protein
MITTARSRVLQFVRFTALPSILILAFGAAAPLHAETSPAANAKLKPATPAAKSPARAPKTKPLPPEIVLPAATQEQRDAAERTYFGNYLCEFNQSIQIDRHPKTEGYVNVAWNKQLFTMKPVLSSTGALRLEDVTGRTLMIQIANKSMLLDTKLGQRLVDECVSPEQRAAIDKAKLADAPPPDSLGIDPVKTAAAKLLADVTAAAATAKAAAVAASAASAASASAASAATSASK